MDNITSGILAGIIGGLIAPIVIAFIAHILGPRLSEKFRLKTKLAESYLAPFKEWCSNLYGELFEFYQRYVTEDYSEDYSYISDLQIIEDYRCLHDSLKETHRWIGKIGKEAIKNSISYLLEIVDVFWHSLENSYSKELPTVKDEVFEAHIKNLKSGRRKVIAQKIRHHLKDEKQTYLHVKISGILSYLVNEIP